MRSHSSSEDLQQDVVDVKEPLTSRYWRDKLKVSCTTKIKAHVAIISSKSSYFNSIFKEKQAVLTHRE